MGKRLRIGQFARLAHVTIRTVRHYEDEGLLRPCCVRNGSRYRYYDAAQLLTFHRIAALPRVGISIPDIRRLLHGSDDGIEVLQAHRERLRSAIDEQTMQLRQLDAMLSGVDQAADFPATCARVRAIPPMIALSRRATVPELSEAVSEMFEGAEADAGSGTMHRWIERAGAVASAPRREIYHRFGADERGYRLPDYRLTSNPADYVTELQMPFAPATR